MVVDLARILVGHPEQLEHIEEELRKLHEHDHDLEAVYRSLSDREEDGMPVHFDDLVRLKMAFFRQEPVGIAQQLWDDLHGRLRRRALSEEEIEHFEWILVAHGLAKRGQQNHFQVTQASYI
jgi:hypothetical protein